MRETFLLFAVLIVLITMMAIWTATLERRIIVLELNAQYKLTPR